jgi:LysR family transcriptional activator of nhaA
MSQPAGPASLPWLNYHHLLYFWTVAREGGVSRAAEKLRLAQPTISAQLRLLEASLGEQLFRRQGRTLVLTEVGQVVFRYADEIFSLGRELTETLRGRPAGRPVQLTVGIANVVPKLVVYRLLQPATRGADPMHVVCREDNVEPLIAQLALHALDAVISDAPALPHLRVKVFNHLLGESGTTFFASAGLAAKMRRRFPASLTGMPLLVPTTNTALRRALDEWMDAEGIRPNVVGEFEDSALMKVFGRAGGVAFPAPTVLERDVCRMYNVRVAGRTHVVRERFYAISVERRLKHPGVVAITTAAREDLFVT